MFLNISSISSYFVLKLNLILVNIINLPEKSENAVVIENISDDCQTVKSLIEDHEEQPCEPPTKKIKLNIKTIEFNLKEVLSKTAFGNSLMLINEHGGNVN